MKLLYIEGLSLTKVTVVAKLRSILTIYRLQFSVMENLEEINIEKEYQQALDFLYGFINLEQKTIDRYHASKMDSDRPSRLLHLLGNPHLDYQTVHIAGTKGKGSVAAVCTSVVGLSGYRVGLYTSPHLRDFRERIRIVSQEDQQGCISKRDLVNHLNVVKPYLEKVPGVTWFEIVTAIAFNYFSDQNVPIAVIEVGLGGRLDATNIVKPMVSVITSLSLDHTNLLGNTLREIAFEKGGIIKSGIPVVSASQSKEALDMLQEIVDERGSPISIVGQSWCYAGKSRELVITTSGDESFIPSNSRFSLALAGDHQLENCTLALAALSEVRKKFPNITLENVRSGLENVTWEGRLQLIHNAQGWPAFLVDSAHNADSAAKLKTALLNEYHYNRLWLLFGAPEDKAIAEMMEILFPLADGIFLSSADHPRAASPGKLSKLAATLGFATIETKDISEALHKIYSDAEDGDLICATGSIIFIGDLLNQWDVLKSGLIDP